MTLKQIEVFLAVADTRSFSKGGDLVSLAQSTVSQHIRALEDELGVRLFDRTASLVSLTEAGRLFHEHARRISRTCDRAKVAMRRFQGLEESLLRVGASTTPASCLIPDILGSFTRVHPGIRLELSQDDSRSVIRRLLSDEVEIAVTGGRFDEDLVGYEQVGSEQVLLVARPGVVAGFNLQVEELKKIPLIVREPGSGTRQAVDAALAKAGVAQGELHVVAQLGSSEAVRRAVLSGAGCAFVSELVVRRELAEGLLMAIPVTAITIVRSFYLAVRHGRTLSPAAAVFFSALRKQCQGGENSVEATET